jgi:hypothetical protein
MKVISVAAPCNGSGKTSLIMAIARTFPGVFSAAKFTTIYREEQFCPVGDHDCACHHLQGQYLICTDPQVLAQPNTDTGKISRAGVRQMYWCISKPEGYPDMLNEFSKRHLNGDTPLLIEGNTIAQFLVPQLRLFLVNPWLPVSWWKKHTDEFLEKSDLIVLNPYRDASQTATPELAPAIVSALDRVRSKQVAMENPERLDQWQDQRLYRAISVLLGLLENSPLQGGKARQALGGVSLEASPGTPNEGHPPAG